jgi:nucleotide-binding universal stress UspA family protein
MPVLIALAVWLIIVVASVLIVTYLAHRWGHDPFGWIFLAAATGPIAIIALLGTRGGEQQRARTLTASMADIQHGSVVIACDGSDATARSAAYAASLFPPDTGFVLLTVEGHEAKPRTPAEETQQAARVEKATAPAVTALAAAERTARIEVAHGSPGEEIVRFAERDGASAIIVGRRGSGLSRALLGSVSEHVVRNAPQPVIVIT